MKVLCIDNTGCYGDEELYYKRTDEKMPILSIDVVYDVRLYTFNHEVGYVVDGLNSSWYFNANRFKDLRLMREEKLRALIG